MNSSASLGNESFVVGLKGAGTGLRCTWLPVHTNTAAGLTLEFEDADASNHRRRFYRARVFTP